MTAHAVGLSQKEEKGAVLNNWPGNIAAKLILNQEIARVHFLSLRIATAQIVEKVIGIQRTVTHLFKQSTMKLIGTTFGNHLNLARTAPKLRIGRRSNNAYFRNGIG